MVTLQRLSTFTTTTKPDITEYMNCRYINEHLSKEIENAFDIPTELVIGGIWQSRSNREEHAYVKIKRQYVEDATNDVIIDGAIKQFCEANRDDLWVVLGPKEELPEVAVLDGTENNEWYEMFLPDRP